MKFAGDKRVKAAHINFVILHVAFDSPKIIKGDFQAAGKSFYQEKKIISTSDLHNRI